MKIDVKFEGMEQFARDLEQLRTKQIPYAMKTFLNTLARECQTLWREETDREYQHGTFWNMRRITLERAHGDMGRPTMQSIVGSTSPFADRLEMGGGFVAKSVLPVAGPVAGGGPPGTPRVRQPLPSRKMGKISITQPSLGRMSRQRANAARIAIARRKGQRYTVLQRPNMQQGIFMVGGGKKHPTAKLIFALPHEVTFKHHGLLERALSKLAPQVERIGVDAIMQQLQYLGSAVKRGG